MREATLDDMPRLLEMGQRFHAASEMPCGFSNEAIAGLLTNLISEPSGAVLISGGGVIGGALSPAYCDPDWIMAVELFWWAEDRQGLRLLKSFEDWAEASGANEVRMTTLSSLPSADRIIRRKGYQPTEISYSKVI
jgi:hypothetical protein